MCIMLGKKEWPVKLIEPSSLPPSLLEIKINEPVRAPLISGRSLGALGHDP